MSLDGSMTLDQLELALGNAVEAGIQARGLEDYIKGSVETRIDTLEDDLSELKGTVDNLAEVDAEDIDTRLSSLEERVPDDRAADEEYVDDKVREVDSALEDLKSDLGTVEENLRADIEALREEVQGLREEVHTLRSRAGTVVDLLSALPENERKMLMGLAGLIAQVLKA